MKDSDKVGIANVVLHTRQHLAALLVSGSILVLDLLRFDHEIRKPEGLKIPGTRAHAGKVTSAEVRMAQKLIEGMTRPWKPSEFHDQYRDDLLALIRKKARSGGRNVEEIELPARPKKSAEVVDLMPLLKQSLEARTKAPAKRARAGTTRRSAAKSRKTRRAKTGS
jgi:DNA end-binding protein Ku